MVHTVWYESLDSRRGTIPAPLPKEGKQGLTDPVDGDIREESSLPFFCGNCLINITILVTFVNYETNRFYSRYIDILIHKTTRTS